MIPTATIRELRNQFPRIRKLVEEAGEVLVTDQGTPRYRLTAYTPSARNTVPSPKDYLARLHRFQPRRLGARAAKLLDEANRG
jgi:antitoxin (DNA-binding transcriptional repressor) of toxin-antitoxin stability system